MRSDSNRPIFATLARLIAIGSLALSSVAVPGNAGIAGAVTPPNIDYSKVPDDARPAPTYETRQGSPCSEAGVMPNSNLMEPAPASASLAIQEAWRFSRGAGAKVAIIDTGVRPQRRLPRLIPGGDYVQAGGDGLTDCDAHGTLVAGIIGAAPAPTDGFAGVAPEATLYSIRQSSAKFSQNIPNPTNDPNKSQTAGNIADLAKAVRHAADLVPRGVINISVVSCINPAQPIDQSALGAAIWYAAVRKDVVVIAAAGNAGGTTGSTSCQQNPGASPQTPTDLRNWNGVKTISAPAWFDKYVVSVGFTAPQGQPSTNASLQGPWVTLGAPGSGIVSLDPRDGNTVVNAVRNSQGQLEPAAGTSYAAAYVSGVAALLRSRFPQLTAKQIIARLTSTAQAPARTPDNVIGHGLIDPVAALTYNVPLDGDAPRDRSEKTLPIADPPPPADTRPRTAATIAVGAVVAAAIVALLLRAGLRRTPNRKEEL